MHHTAPMRRTCLRPCLGLDRPVCVCRSKRKHPEEEGSPRRSRALGNTSRDKAERADSPDPRCEHKFARYLSFRDLVEIRLQTQQALKTSPRNSREADKEGADSLGVRGQYVPCMGCRMQSVQSEPKLKHECILSLGPLLGPISELWVTRGALEVIPRALQHYPA